MKEFVVKVPDETTELVTELVERLGGEVQEKKTTNRSTSKKITPQKITPLDFFGKYPDFPLDPETYREQLWGRKRSL